MVSDHTAPFAALPFHVFGTAGRAAVRGYVLDNPQLAREHLDTRTRRGTVLRYFPPPLILPLVAEDVARLRADCPLPFGVDLIYLPPGAQVARHVDGAHWARSCVLATPLHPAQGYPSTLYWPSMQAQAPSHRVDWDGLPVLLDVQQPHSLGNPGAEPRFNLQLTFGTPFKVVRDLLVSGGLDCLCPSPCRL